MGEAAKNRPAERFEAVIGLECHVQLQTETKIFSASSAAFGAPPNSNIDPVCLGLPGVLPVLNRKVVEYALRMAIATNSKIRSRCRFARKHYFYPDLPKGYQISQFDEPIAEHGTVEFRVRGELKRIRLTRIHLEEDAGKNLHAPGGGDLSLVDYNRAGVPLIEVVSEPDFRSAEEAGEYLRSLRQLVRYLGICDGNMEEGSLRCDANVSIRPVGQTELGTKTELKNINSFRYVEEAITHEIERQKALVERGERIVQESRLWDSAKKNSQAMRSKEEAHDYRYFPEPDLPPLVVSDKWIADVTAALPELPAVRRERFTTQFGLSEYDAGVLTAEKDLADYYEAATKGGDPKKVANWISTELLRELNKSEQAISKSPISPQSLGELVGLVDSGTLSGKMAKEVFAEMWTSGKGAKAIVEAKGLSQVSDTSAIEAACKAVVEASPKEVAGFKSGKTQLLGFFVGQVMKRMQGKANPAIVNEILQKLLGGT